MSGKYSGLPDIDSAQDIYETADEPVVTAHRDEDEDPKKAVGRSEDIDVGDLPSRRRALKVFTEPGDVIEPPRETQLSRLRRLQAEVTQLERELHSSPVPTRSDSTKRKSVLPPRHPVDVVSELSALRERLNTASDGTHAPEQKDFTNRLAELEVTPERKDSEKLAPLRLQVGDVDKRLAVLERAVGVADTDADSSQVSLSDTLARLDHFMNLLTQPRHLDSVARRVKLLLADLDRAAASRRPGAPASPVPGVATLSPTDLERLQSLFALFPRLDPLLPVIPPLLTRLRSLSTLHAESIAIADDLRELQSSDRAVAEEERELRAIVSGVRKGMADASASISQNWESVQARLAALGDKLAKLDV
ncbi:hypothetical protein CspHIS471_0704630 [Cutaneotrichosporon sp. HIS471]|nr:hypothetical protein CspHIS471_0704630 [Cutaneotrichosporon sp. HIS471]